jgi:DNA-binding MarR family transcriptional regulator
MSTTRPSRRDVERLVVALFTSNASLDRARRRSKGASALGALQTLEGRQGVRPSEIATTLQVHPSLVSRQVQELEASGFAAVRADDGDKRSCLVSLTDQGQDELARLREFGLTRFASFVADWQPAEVRELTRLLEKLEASKAVVAERERPASGRGRWRTPRE